MEYCTAVPTHQLRTKGATYFEKNDKYVKMCHDLEAIAPQGNSVCTTYGRDGTEIRREMVDDGQGRRWQMANHDGDQ